MEDLFVKMTFLMFNNILLKKFNLKVTSKGNLLYYIRSDQFLRTMPLQNKTHYGWSHYVKITSDFKKLFVFLGLNYDSYTKGFKNAIEYFYWLTESPFLDVMDWRKFEHYISSNRESLGEELYDFCKIIYDHSVLNMEELPDERDRRDLNSIVSNYANVPELMVRSFFRDEKDKSFEKDILSAKYTYMPNKALNKFSSRKLIEWFPLLQYYEELTFLFFRRFVNYVTEEEPNRFPHYLADKESVVVEYDARNFYNNVFVELPEFVSFMQKMDGDDSDEDLC